MDINCCATKREEGRREVVKNRGKRSGGAEERRSGGAEERRSGGAEERRSGGAEERRSGGAEITCFGCRPH
jgi:hypothetical protein